MATVGDQLALPESGWRRYDDTHVGLKYTGSWYKVTSTTYYNGSVNVTTRAADNNYVTFSFYGTKVRIISDIAQDRHSDNTITVDGATEAFTTNKTGTTVLNAIVYEKTNLPLGFHTVTITIGHNRTNFIMDAIDIDETGYLYGYSLTAPEDGWKRYDDAEPSFSYTGFTQRNLAVAGAYEGKSSYNANGSAVGEVVFSFVGTKIRIISSTTSTVRAESISVSIDGSVETFTARTAQSQVQTLVYEKKNLPYGTHTVKIFDFKGVMTGTAAAAFGLDAIDIDSDGRLIRSVGSEATAPEDGWRRYDTDDYAQFLGTDWKTVANSTGRVFEGGSVKYSNVIGNQIKFSFAGDKLRLIAEYGSAYDTNVEVSIDGVIKYINLSTSSSSLQSQRIVFEQFGLTDGVHEVIVKKVSGTGNFHIDAIDINVTGRMVRLIGTQLTTPDEGWKRYDDNHPTLKWGGSVTFVNNSTVDYNGTLHYWTDATKAGSSLEFTFIGTKLRLIAGTTPTQAKEIRVFIDGNLETYNPYNTTDIRQILVYEKTGLSNTPHTVRLDSVGAGNWGIDAIDIDSDGHLITNIGSQIPTPDEGWRRYDNKDSSLAYTGTWGTWTSTSYYSGEITASNVVGSKVKFSFEGTKLRIIDERNMNRSRISRITIDGVSEVLGNNYGTQQMQTLVYEKTGLIDNIHYVEVEIMDANYIGIDAIDIDSNGRLYHPDEVTNITELEIGKRIRCHYIAARNSAGVFSRLGEETFDFISPSGSPIPMGDFYWIMVEDWNKRKFLVADRNIQNAVSWDSINKEGYVFGVESTTILNTHNKTPYLTSASDVYSVTGVGNSLTNEDPWRAFSLNGSWGSYAGTGLILDCKRKVKFGEIKVTAYRGANMASVIDVYGSDNNVDYTLIKSCQKSTWIDSEQATFYFDEPVEYRYYKIMKTTQVSNSNAARLNLELSYSEKIDNNHIFKVRLLTGGINATDKDNEWDKCIVNSTLNGKIIAGDNNVWNYGGGASWTSTTNAAGSGNRTGRGASGNAGASGYNPTSYVAAATATGFRPLMEIEILPMIRSLIKHEGAYKKYQTEALTWNTISATLPVEDTFINDGMDDLSVLDRKNEVFIRTMTANRSLGSGKLFKERIDLNKFFEITNVSVK
ncbi:hypothetical protein OM416_13225 [Paenibacillus sp. LS1]|uniref:hypothetical protein n=1 Tax=Paenibacillus sp. LS1 TaxID=2992120 RepID=UPI00222F9571|nr:hypothetical protein [Paenibacillus sp. LS1]MCW3792551.1 hypothetical protein [Paenibacillus sp. LS1]